LLPFIVIGLTSGAVYALAGLGLVLTYKTSGVFNFALGALATVAAYVFYVLYVLNHWAWPLAAFVAVCVAGPLMGLGVELLARRIQTVSLAWRVASTVGLLLVIIAGIDLIYGTETTREVPIFLGAKNFNLFGTNVQESQAITFLFAVVVTVVLTIFFRVARRGKAMRAVVDNPELLDIAGTSPTNTRRLAWIIGMTLAAASGVLFAPVEQLDPVQLTLLVVSAFGAAAIGGFTNMPVTLAGGLGIGVLSALCTKWFTTGFLSALSVGMPYIVLFGVLLVFPRRYLVGKSFTVPTTRPTWHAPGSLQLTGGIALIVFLLLVPGFAGVHLTDWTTFVAMSIVFMSLGLLVRTSGQVSLCHVAFIAIGACAFSHLTVGSHVGWWLALVLCGLIAVPIGALLAVPSIRLTGLYLAIATFGFGFLLQTMFYTQSFMFGANGIGRAMPRPSLASGDKSFYFLCLVLAIITAIFIVVLNRTRLGRLLRGGADSRVALETSGTSVKVTRVLVFCLSAFLAAIGGALAGVSATTISADSYQPILSLTYFALIVIVIGSEPWDAVLASAGLILIPSYVSGSNVNNWLQLVFGASAIAIAIIPARLTGAPLALRTALDASFGRIKLPKPRLLQRSGEAPAQAVLEGGLEISDIEVRFGGLVAVDRVSISAPSGQVTGLIGPNGAGKTTTFNACTGLVKPSSGGVTIGGVDVSRRGPAARARLGLGRTFQKMELFETLTVRENVAAGAEGVLAGYNPISHFAAKPGEAGAVHAAAQRAMELCELTELADTPAASLSTGQRRLVELARCLAGPFGLLLLDEPSSGLDRAETARFGEILKKVVADRGIGILLVEHDMSLVLDICEHVYVLDFGELIFEGSPAEIGASSIVRAAYLGDDEVEQAVDPTHLIEELA
jgi:ABC-type branched-subunit amino acid transport system ATPase component/branched-subunit amino acid ABC-type transport system permease component